MDVGSVTFTKHAEWELWELHKLKGLSILSLTQINKTSYVLLQLEVFGNPGTNGGAHSCQTRICV